VIDQQIRAESKTGLVEQVKICLRSGDYSRALDLLRGVATELPNDTELSELEKLAHDGVKRNGEANRLITRSQELFAQRKAAEAIQLLREAYEIDKNNSLARAILANALVEHAHSIVETDWLQAETFANQALALNPVHPTAKTILSLIVDQKEKSSVEDWVSHAHKLQSAGDLFAALAWVAEGLAVHPHDPKLLQIQDAIQRDQDARRRQTRRGDLEDLRRLQQEINGASDVAAKQVLAARIQAVAAKYWTDGEILSIANALLLRLGLIPPASSSESSSGSPPSKTAAVILHVPRPSAQQPLPADSSQIPPSNVSPSQMQTRQIQPSPVLPNPVLPNPVPAVNIPINTISPQKAPKITLEPQPVTTPAVTIPVAEPSTPAAKVTSRSSQSKEPTNSTTLILISTAATIIVFSAIFFIARKHPAPPIAKTTEAPAVSAPTASAPVISMPPVSVPAAVPAISPPAQTTPAPATPEPSLPATRPSSDTVVAKVVSDNQSPAETAPTVGSLVVVANQNDARVFLNGKPQPQLTQAGQLRIPNLGLKNYVVQVSKSGFQDPPQQEIRIHKGEQARLIFNLEPPPQPQPRLASLTIQGGVPGTSVFIDQTLVGTIPPDGTLAVSTVNPGDHTVELRKERFTPRQHKEHFIAGADVSLAAADAALEAAPGELKINFAPADARVALVRGDLLTMVSSGAPLKLVPGTYTLTARTADKFTRSSTLEVIAGQSRTLDLSLAPNGLSKWDDPGAWKQEKDSFVRKGGDFVLYSVVPASGTFVFSAMPAKGHLLQWVLNYTDPKNYVLFQMDDNNFYRTIIRNGQKTDEIKVPYKSDKKSFRALHIRVSRTEIVHEVRDGNSWTVIDRWSTPGADLAQGKFGFYIPGNDQVSLSSFAHYADLIIR
jgi:tetratricopeptide (TPR) repeat protein